MADQASVRRLGLGLAATPTGAGPGPESASNGRGKAETGDLVTNFMGFGENLWGLSELQARLAALELKQNVQRARTGGLVVLGFLVLGASALPVFLAGIAEVLVSQGGFSRGPALLIVGGATIALAALAAGAVALWLRSRLPGFPLTREELARNLSWVRTVLQHSGRAARPSRR